MAERRMFTKKITDSDDFISLSSSAQALYFHLNMAADDDGFNNQIQNAMFKSHSTADDFNVLLAKKFIIRFESGVIVIRHWRMHNYIQNDRKSDTEYSEELSQLVLLKNKSYDIGTENVSETDPKCIQNVSKMYPQVRIGKDRIDKDSIGYNPPLPPKEKICFSGCDYVTMTNTEHQKLLEEFGEDATNEMIEILNNYKGSSGKKYKSDYMAIRSWVIDRWKDNHREKFSQQSQMSTADIVRQRLKERNIEF